MKKLVLCDCGSGRFKEECCPTNVQVWTQPIANAEERERLIEKLLIGKEFDMRHRGLVQYYGEDLIQYKREQPGDQMRNHFLTVFSKYMTDYLEDAFPSSWQECDQSFWEEFLLTHYPYHIQISKDEKNLNKFLNELKKFTGWLDRKYQTHSAKIVKELIDMYYDDLKRCESVTNTLYNYTFPNIHDKKSNIQTEIFRHLDQMDEFDESTFCVLKINSINGPIVHATDMATNHSLQIIELPSKALHPDIFLGGTIGKKKDSWLWTWYSPLVAFPSKAEKYLENVLFYC